MDVLLGGAISTSLGDGGGDLNYTMVVYHLALCSLLILSLITLRGNAEKRSYMTCEYQPLLLQIWILCPSSQIFMGNNTTIVQK